MASRPKQTEITEEMIASVLPVGEKMLASDMMAALNVSHTVTMYSFTAVLKNMRDIGFLRLHRRSNRAHLWARLREPVRTPSSRDRDTICGVAIERVAIGGSTSGHHGASQDKPALVSLPKMPTLKSVEANA